MCLVSGEDSDVAKTRPRGAGRHLHAPDQQSQHAIGLRNSGVDVVCECMLDVQNNAKISSPKLMAVEHVRCKVG